MKCRDATTLARGALRAYRAALGISSSSGAVKVPNWASAKDLLRAARLTKQLARSSTSSASSSSSLLSSSSCSPHSSDMALAEVLLRAAAATQAEDTTSPAVAALSDGCAGDGGGESRRAAQSDLGVLLCQEGRDDEAAEVLTAMGFRYRLGKDVLRYPVRQRNNQKKAEATMEAHRAYVRAFDGAMPERMLRHLRRVFGARSSFWSQHGGAAAHVKKIQLTHEL